jgi:hypothetical protein
MLKAQFTTGKVTAAPQRLKTDRTLKHSSNLLKMHISSTADREETR